LLFSKLKRAPFYKTLLELRKNNPALAANAGFTKLETNMDNNVYAFMREKDEHKVVVLLNLSQTPQSFKVRSPLVNGKVRNVFTNGEEEISSESTRHLPEWGFAVYEYK